MFEGQGMPSYRVAGSSRCFSLVISISVGFQCDAFRYTVATTFVKQLHYSIFLWLTVIVWCDSRLCRIIISLMQSVLISASCYRHTRLLCSIIISISQSLMDYIDHCFDELVVLIDGLRFF